MLAGELINFCSSHNLERTLSSEAHSDLLWSWMSFVLMSSVHETVSHYAGKVVL